jgi:2-oxoglutarate ferredoxin oxidoreductase subunit delta
MIETKKQKVVQDAPKTKEGKKAMVEEEFWRKPLDKTELIKKEGNIHVIDSRCKGCAFCIEFCPKKVLVQSEDINEKGYHPPIVARPDDCVFCGLCQMLCPDFAIYIEVTKSNEEEVVNKNNNNSSDKKEDKNKEE